VSDEPSPRAGRWLVIGCAAAIGFILVYALVDYARLPRVWHDQVARSLRWDTIGRGPQPAGYVGLWLWGLVAALASAGLAALGLRLAWTLSAFLLVGGYFTWNLWP
jgi:hypothetical protein